MNWTLVRLEGGQRTPAQWRIGDGITTLGRAEDRTIRLRDRSVSRKHARLDNRADGLFVLAEDEAHNGLLVNGLLKGEAKLQDQDRLRLGEVELQVLNSAPISTYRPGDTDLPHGAGELTVIQPRAGDDKLWASKGPQLHALLQLCSRFGDGCNLQTVARTCLPVLLDAYSASHVQLFDATRKCVGAFKSEDDGSLKLGDFVLEKMQGCTEAAIMPGSEIQQKGQQAVRDFNFLVGPLHNPAERQAKHPFVVLVRRDDWNPFTPVDRSLLELVCQTWTNGQSRLYQIHGLRRENAQLKQNTRIPALLGENPLMITLRQRAKRFAETDGSVLITGENGSGKEVVAHFVHQNSLRRDKPFIIVNVAAIPQDHIESELFGHVRGAFPGAEARRGKFEVAHEGTIMLDEIGELPLELQPKLLRAIEVKEIQPLGAEAVRKVNVRILAATNCELKDMVDRKLFRADLFHRLNQLPLRVPPLHQRLDDLPLLANNFLSAMCAEREGPRMSFSQQAMDELKRHPWPGNVRELLSVVQRCVTFSGDPILSPEIVREALQM